ncbi:MAG: hypothetical protein OXF55_05055 [Caldilineaceae bacterium]|nr:hypothetical protein [Caldilineaceae bacterium]
MPLTKSFPLARASLTLDELARRFEWHGAERRQGIGVGGYYLDAAIAVIGRASFGLAADADFEAQDFAICADLIGGAHRLPAMNLVWIFFLLLLDLLPRAAAL